MCVLLRELKSCGEPDGVHILGRNPWPCQNVINVIWGKGDRKNQNNGHHLATLPQTFQDVMISFYNQISLFCSTMLKSVGVILIFIGN